MTTAYIKNNKGMAALLIAAATTQQHLVFASFAGALTAVKAIWASIISRRSRLILTSSRYVNVTGDPNLQYITIKHSLAPRIYLWTVLPEPTSDAPIIPLLPLNGVPREQQLISLLTDHTLWPVLPAWANTLWQDGTNSKAIQRLHTHGNLEWAYAIQTAGWHDIIDAAAKRHSLTFPKE